MVLKESVFSEVGGELVVGVNGEVPFPEMFGSVVFDEDIGNACIFSFGGI